MKMFIVLLVVVAAAGVAPLAVLGCSSGYESPESLVKKARLILEVEAVAVSDFTPPDTGLVSATFSVHAASSNLSSLA